MGHQKLSSLYTFTRGCSGKRTSHERKTSEAPHIRRQSVSHRENPSIASSFPARFPFSSCYCEKWRDPGNHVGGWSIKVKSKRCWSIIWQTFPTGSSPVSPLLIIFCQKKSLHRHNPGNNFLKYGTRYQYSPIDHTMTTEYIILKCLNIEPLHPNISLHILLTVLYTFPKVLTRRICLIIKRFPSWWSFLVFSCP